MIDCPSDVVALGWGANGRSLGSKLRLDSLPEPTVFTSVEEWLRVLSALFSSIEVITEIFAERTAIGDTWLSGELEEFQLTELSAIGYSAIRKVLKQKRKHTE
jgi:hypothetical protein